MTYPLFNIIDPLSIVEIWTVIKRVSLNVNSLILQNSKKPHPLLASVEHSTSAEHIQKVRRPPRKSELAHSASVSTTSTMDDEACSTDSNSNSAPIDDAVPRQPKKTKTKLKMFPRFGRKISKNSSTTHVHSE